MFKAIKVNHIKKSYTIEKSSVTALDDVSFEVEKGEIFGLIGPDGAGKTSLLRILTTLILPDSGTAMVNEMDVVKQYKEIRQSVGYMPGKFSLYQDLSVEENLEFFASIFKTTIKENYELVKDIYIQIEPFKKRRAGALSGGMKQKLALSCALIHKPSVLFLDEPTTGVDAVSRKEFWHMLKNLKEQGITIIVSTPYMDEAGLCDRVALIQKGKIMSINSPKTIMEQFGRPIWAVKTNEMFRMLHDIRDWDLIASCYPFGEFDHVVFKDQKNAKMELTKYLESKRHTGIVVTPIAAGIEDCFMDLMKIED